jgi:hypothetical protein
MMGGMGVGESCFVSKRIAVRKEIGSIHLIKVAYLLTYLLHDAGYYLKS